MIEAVGFKSRIVCVSVPYLTAQPSLFIRSLHKYAVNSF